MHDHMPLTCSMLDTAERLGAKAEKRWTSDYGAPCLPTCLDECDREVIARAGGNPWAPKIVGAYLYGWRESQKERK